VELILAVAALRRGLFAVVAASLVGSILSNLLLVLGCAFLFGGLANHGQRFSSSANKVLCSLLMVACLCFSLPSVSRAVYGRAAMPPAALALLSRVIALALIGLYGLYLYFQLISHPELFAAESGGEEEEEEEELGGALAMERGGGGRGRGGGGSGSVSPRRPRRTSSVTRAPPRPAHEQSALSTSGALAALLAVTLVVAACSEALTGALEPVVAATGVPAAFIGLVVLPIVSSAASLVGQPKQKTS
jgi:Ca2+:H+ antiporter